MPRSPDYGQWQYRGGWDECYLCGGEKLPWQGAMICVVCDNRDDGEATWFDLFAQTEEP